MQNFITLQGTPVRFFNSIKIRIQQERVDSPSPGGTLVKNTDRIFHGAGMDQAVTCSFDILRGQYDRYCVAIIFSQQYHMATVCFRMVAIILSFYSNTFRDYLVLRSILVQIKNIITTAPIFFCIRIVITENHPGAGLIHFHYDKPRKGVIINIIPQFIVTYTPVRKIFIRNASVLQCFHNKRAIIGGIMFKPVSKQMSLVHIHIFFRAAFRQPIPIALPKLSKQRNLDCFFHLILRNYNLLCFYIRYEQAKIKLHPFI